MQASGYRRSSTPNFLISSRVRRTSFGLNGDIQRVKRRIDIRAGALVVFLSARWLQVIALPLERWIVLTDPRMKFSGSVVSWLPAQSVVVG